MSLKVVEQTLRLFKKKAPSSEGLAYIYSEKKIRAINMITVLYFHKGPTSLMIGQMGTS
jgi:hypothetical protein